MSDVMMPQKKPSQLAGMLPVVGSVAGSFIGGPVGGAVGGAIGGAMSRAGQGRATGNIPRSTSAMQRRQDAMDPQDTLAVGQQALEQLPPEYQQQYGPALEAARQASMQRRMA